MIPYLHILIRVEDDGSLHALGAFTSKEKENAYRIAAGLKENQVRLDFHNGPFEEDTKVVYAGHRRWNMNRFQLAGYFQSEGESWSEVTQEGYVSVLKIDTDYASEQALKTQALERYNKLQKRWRLSTYQELIEREGSDKALANIMLRFYEDALESFKPQSRRDIRALYALCLALLILPIALFYCLSHSPDFGENVKSVSWLPDDATQISYYRSKQVQVYEFKISPEHFKSWAESHQMAILPIDTPAALSRYKAYLPIDPPKKPSAASQNDTIAIEQFSAWQNEICIKISQGLIAESPDHSIGTALYDPATGKAYVENLINF